MLSVLKNVYFDHWLLIMSRLKSFDKLNGGFVISAKMIVKKL